MATKHTVFAQLTDRNGTAYEGISFDITLPDEEGVNDSHVFAELKARAKTLPYSQTNETVTLGPSSLTQIEAGKIEWAVQASQPV